MFSRSIVHRYKILGAYAVKISKFYTNNNKTCNAKQDTSFSFIKAARQSETYGKLDFIVQFQGAI